VPTHQIGYQLICRWNAGCRRWPAPRIAEWFGDRGIWFLRPVGSSFYGPPGNGGIDPGFRSIEQRADFEQYISRYKRSTETARRKDASIVHLSRNATYREQPERRNMRVVGLG
jgi:hypothetical protein